MWERLDPTSRGLLVVQVLGLITFFLVLVLPGAGWPASLKPVISILGTLGAAVACTRTARSGVGPGYRRSWQLLGGAFLSFVAGHLGLLASAWSGQNPSGLSSADVPFLLFYPLALLSAIFFPRKAGAGRDGLSAWLDAGMAMVGAWMVVWFGFGDETIRVIIESPNHLPGTLIYPFADLILIFGVVLLIHDSVEGRGRMAGGLVALALFMIGLADIDLTMALRADEPRLAVAGRDLAYSTAGLLATVAASAFRIDTGLAEPVVTDRGGRLHGAPALSLLVPVAGATAGFVFLAFDAAMARDVREGGLVVGALLLLGLAAAHVSLAERRSAARTRELSEALEWLRLSQTAAEAEREKAEQALQAKSHFFAVMGHEIRTPLNAVIGMSEVLLSTPLSASQRESAETIRQGGDALLAVVNDLLDYSKMEAGRLEIERAPLNPRRAIERLVGLMRQTAEAKGLTLEARVGPMPRVALGDESRLGQILLNLLSNAIKFSDRGSITVRARSSTSETAHVLTVSVSDPGVGIPKDKLHMLFQPFGQLSPGLSRSHGGTGLGLAICKRLTEAMGGWITVESTEGAGSTFTFEIRLGLAPHIVTAPIRDAAASLEHYRSGSKKRKVLVVEDNLVNQQVICSMVELLGHEVDLAPSGHEAVRLVEQSVYDVVLTDLMMPDMDGVETTRRIRETENGKKATVIAVTAAATVEDRERCLASGMDGFLPKPFTIDSLGALFARVS